METTLELNMKEFVSDDPEYVDVLCVEFYTPETIGRLFFRAVDGDSLYIAWFEIFPEFQGKGLGVMALESFLKKYKDFSVTLMVAECNAIAIRLYEKLGFEFLPGQEYCIYKDMRRLPMK